MYYLFLKLPLYSSLSLFSLISFLICTNGTFGSYILIIAPSLNNDSTTAIAGDSLLNFIKKLFIKNIKK